jgi:hypothetical protein
MHCPAVLHVWPPEHAAHAAPPVPHEVGVCALNSSHLPVLVLQQPCLQLVALQLPVPPSMPESVPVMPESVVVVL